MTFSSPADFISRRATTPPAKINCPLCGSASVAPITAPNENYLCADCDLRFLAPALRLSPDAEKVRYATHRNDIAEPGYRAFLTPLLNAMRPHLDPGAEGLDFGCGPTPALAQLFQEVGFTMATFDPFFACNTERLGRAYDFVVASEVAEHFHHPLRDFERLFSLVKPGGWLGVMTLFYKPGSDFASWYYRRDPTHVVFYSQATLNWIAKRVVFTDLTFVGERIALLRRPL